MVSHFYDPSLNPKKRKKKKKKGINVYFANKLCSDVLRMIFSASYSEDLGLHVVEVYVLPYRYSSIFLHSPLWGEPD